MQSPSNPVRADYSFTVEKNGNVHTINYQRAKYGAGIILPILFPSIVVSFILVMVMHGNFAGWLFMTLLLSLGTFFLLNFLRKDGSFAVSDKALIVEGKEYDKAHISNLFIKAPGGYEETTTVSRTGHGFIFGGDRPTRVGLGAATAVTGTIGGIAQSGGIAMQGSRRSIQKHYQKINYSIGFCYGEKNVRLATGLKENTAYVMLDKVIELSGPAA